ncbi:ABC transporter permease [Paenibacillus sp. JX-17]|uniref:ABC transporter permease n=1 Tax=Paenibacillus lacisoli TaxID=3064525 RepID=A0ABT9CG66_9BACL|nr:ABC transporter permease [Paenibacillus sp. JX-17]MDO7908270.1 ABC transporter permease [Paenibacillus sp. JX-17]
MNRLEAERAASLTGRKTGAEQLFRRRFKEYMTSQFRVLRLAADWTVLLYIIIPALLYGGFAYSALWREPLPAWALQLPFTIELVLLQILMLAGTVHYYLEEADSLFIRQHSSWVLTIKRFGMRWSLISWNAVILFALGLLSPLLVRGIRLTAAGMLLLAGWTVAVTSIQMLVTHAVRVSGQGWRTKLALLSARSGLSLLYVGIAVQSRHPWLIALCTAAGFSLLPLFARWRLRHSAWDGEVREDLHHRMRLTSILLSQAVDKPKRVPRRSFLFKGSRRLLPVRSERGRIVDLCLKSMLRDGSQRLLYLQLIGFGAVAVLLPPAWIGVIIGFVMLLLQAYWLYGVWGAFTASGFYQLLGADSHRTRSRGSFAVSLLLAPPAVILGAAVAIRGGGGWWLLSILLAPVLGWIISGLLQWYQLGRSGD